MSSAPATSSLTPPETGVRRKLATDSLVLSGVFALLLFGPLAFGAVDPWSTFVLEAGAMVLLALWVWKQAVHNEIKIRENPLYLPMLAFGAVTLAQLVFGWTAYRHDTFSQALLYLAYGLFAFLASQCLRRSTQAKTLAVVVSAYGVALASFALLQGLSPNGKQYWIRTPPFGGWIYGPYANHSHYAGLMEMLVPVPLVFCLTRFAKGRVRAVAAGGAALMASTIFLSGSRGGMVAIVVEFIVLGFILVRLKSGSKSVRGLGYFAVMVVFLLIGVGGVELTQRVATLGSETQHEISGGVRWTINKDGIRMFAKKPILGWGLGAFPIAYPQFRTFYTNFFVNEAHNDYLQLLVEMGLVGFGIMLWFLINLFRSAIRKLPDWPNETGGAVTLACLMGCVGILVHSFVDFNLEVQANAAWFYVLCALAASPHPIESRQRMRRARSRSQQPDLEDPAAQAAAS